MSELIEVVQLPDGEQMKKIRNKNGGFSYRRGSNGQFLSPKVGKALEQNADRQVGRDNNLSDNQAQFSVKPRSENDRETLVNQRYPNIDETTGLNPKRIDSGNQKEQNIKAWMDNTTIKKQVKNDPLLNTQQERDRAREARARQITNDLQGVENEREAIKILRDYGVDSA